MANEFYFTMYAFISLCLFLFLGLNLGGFNGAEFKNLNIRNLGLRTNDYDNKWVVFEYYLLKFL
jgi:hypothetical protein